MYIGYSGVYQYFPSLVPCSMPLRHIGFMVLVSIFFLTCLIPLRHIGFMVLVSIFSLTFSLPLRHIGDMLLVSIFFFTCQHSTLEIVMVSIQPCFLHFSSPGMVQAPIYTAELTGITPDLIEQLKFVVRDE